MPFKKGDPKPPGSGIKKGQKHEKTKAEEACSKLGIDAFELLARAALAGSESCIIHLCKSIEPPKKPVEVAVDPAKNTIRIFIEDYGSKDCSPTQTKEIP